MKKLIVLKTNKLIWMLCYTSKKMIGLSNKGNVYIFFGNRLQKSKFFSIDKNKIIYIFCKNTNILFCVHKNQAFSEFNLLKYKFEKKIKLNKFFISRISNIKIFQKITIIVLKNQEIFFFDEFYIMFKKIGNNHLKFGKVIMILNLYKNFFYYSTEKGYLCVFNLKKNLKFFFLSKKIFNNPIIGLHVTNKNFFLVIDTHSNYCFFKNQNFFLYKKIGKKKINLVIKKNICINAKYITLFVEDFLLVWSNSFDLNRKQPSVIIKINNYVGKFNYCSLFAEKNIIAITFYSKYNNKNTSFMKIKKFKHLFLCTELNINFKKYFKKFPIIKKIIFLLNEKILSGIIDSGKKFFVFTFKENNINILIVKINTKRLIFKKEQFLDILLIDSKIILLTKSNSLLIFNKQEGFLMYKKRFPDDKKIKSVSTGFIKNRILILLYNSGKIEIYKPSSKKMFKLFQLFFPSVKIKKINFFGISNHNALLLIKDGFIIIPFFFNFNKKKIRIFSKYTFNISKIIFPIIFQKKNLLNKLIIFKCS